MGKKSRFTKCGLDKGTYLSFVQSNIARMSNYSCAIKGSCCAFLLAQLALFQQSPLNEASYPLCLLLQAVCSFAFSLFDGKYLQLERQYRVLYREAVSAGRDFSADLVLPAPRVCDETRKRDVYFSWSVLGFYFVLSCISISTSMLVLLG